MSYVEQKPRRKSKAGGCLVILVLLVAIAVGVGFATGAIAHVQYVLSGAQDRGAEAIDIDFEARIDAELQDRYYAYSQLDSEGKRCYRIMYDAFRTREPRAYPENGADNARRHVRGAGFDVRTRTGHCRDP